MASKTPDLPDGTDHVVEPGGPTTTSTTTNDAASGASSSARNRFDETKQALLNEATTLRDNATGRARDYARQGKDKTSGTLRDVSKALDDAAKSVDERLGEQYGEYARLAAGAVGDFAGKLESKDVDELLKDAEDMVRKSPVVAIGLAAAAGFAIARVIKSGFDDVDQTFRGPRDTAKAGSDTGGTGAGNSTTSGTTTSE